MRAAIVEHCAVARQGVTHHHLCNIVGVAGVDFESGLASGGMIDVKLAGPPREPHRILFAERHSNEGQSGFNMADGPLFCVACVKMPDATAG